MAVFPEIQVNAVVRTMIASDFLMVSSTGFLSPIIAVYITEQIAGGTLAVVGFSTTVYWVTKSIVQVPVSIAIDAKKGELDDHTFVVLGTALAGVVQLLYFAFASEAWHIYALRMLDGIAGAFMIPSWLAIFTRHIDRGHEGTDWMLHSNAIGLGYAVAAGVGAVLAERFGFRSMFLVTASFLFLSAGVLYRLRPKLYVTDAGDNTTPTVTEKDRTATN